MKNIGQVEIKWIIKEWDEISDTIYEFFGSGGTLILRYIGIGIGRSYAEAIKRYDATFQERLRTLSEYFAQRALGNLIFADVEESDLLGRIIIQETSLKTPHSRFILYGIIAGFLEGIAGKKISVKETRNNFPSELEAIFYPKGGES